MTLSFDALVLGPCVDAFGEVAQGYAIPVCTPVAGGEPFSCDGVFDAAYRDIDPLGALIVTAPSAPTLGVRLSQFPSGIGPQQNDAWLIRGKNYVVREVRPDGQGMARLLLNLGPVQPPSPPPPPAAPLGSIDVGGYIIERDADGNLVVVAPDGTIIPLVRHV